MKKGALQPTHCAEQLGALAAPERLKLVCFIRSGPHNVSEIAVMLATAPVNVAHHMGILRQAPIVERRKQGWFVFYALTPGFLKTEARRGQGVLRPGPLPSGSARAAGTLVTTRSSRESLDRSADDEDHSGRK